MIIVLEGPDGCGKSTLIKQLNKDLGLPIFQSGGPKTKEAMEKMLDELEIMSHCQQIYLCDRAPFVSEIIYSQAFGREPVIPAKDLMDYWLLPNLKIIYCRIDQAAALANMDRKFKPHKPAEHTAIVEQRHANICELYDDIMDSAESARIKVFEYDWRDSTHYQQLKDFINEQ